MPSLLLGTQEVLSEYFWNDLLNEWILLSHLKLSVINKIEAYLIICSVVTSNIHSDRGKGIYRAALLALLHEEDGETWWPPLKGLDNWKSLRPGKVERGLPKTLALLSVQQTVCLFCYWGSKWLPLLSHAHLSQRWAYSQFGKQKSGVLRQENLRESFLQEMLHFGLVDHDKLARWSSFRLIPGAPVHCFPLRLVVSLVTGQLLGRWQFWGHLTNFEANWL